MHSTGVSNEVDTGPRVPREELVGEHVPFHSVTRRASRNKIPGGVRATPREGEDMIEGGRIEVEPRGAVDAAAAAVTHGSALERALDVAMDDVPSAASQSAWRSGE